MSLIKCPKCGAKISDKSYDCIKCDCSMFEIIKIKRRKFIKKLIFISIATITILIVAKIGSVIYTNFQDHRRTIQAYNSAVQAYESKDYKTAYKYFSTSKYGDSEKYLIKTIHEYTEYLINAGSFSTASDYLKLISDKNIHKDLEIKLNYARGVDYYNKGSFEDALAMFKNISEYKDSKNYSMHAELMKNIQGEWFLKGSIINGLADLQKITYSTLNIEGWHATLNHTRGIEDNNVLSGDCILQINNDNDVIFKTQYIEYIITYHDSPYPDYLSINIIKDSFFKTLMRHSKYILNYSGNRDTPAYTKYIETT